jgi:type I restriction enzyme S subunit
MSRVKHAHPKDWIATNLGDEHHFSFVPVGVPSFSGEKKYLSTSSVVENRIDHIEAMVSYDERPSRANMHPVMGSAWFAKMKDTLKVFAVTDKDFEDSYILSTGFQGVVPQNGDVRFLKQIFLSPYFNAEKNVRAKGSTMKAVNNSDVKNIPVLVPPVEEQKKIADVLESLDEEIEKTVEFISATEKLKRGLMQQLFTRGIGHKKFKKTEVGNIPQEWEVRTLGDVVKLSTGTTPSTSNKAYYQGSIPFVKTGDIVNNVISQTNVFISDQAYEKFRLKKYKPGTLLMAMYGQGKTRGQVSLLNIEACTTQNAAAIEPTVELDSKYLWFLLRSQYEHLRQSGVQGHISHLSLNVLKKYLIAVPPVAEQKKIADIIASLEESIDLNRSLQNKLSLLKVGVMNDLLSGKKRTV